MTEEVLDFWQRAMEALAAAEMLLGREYDSCASRAYYAAFNGISALFALDGLTFTKHTAVMMAVHRDLVKTGRWPMALGQGFTFLAELRSTGDYGGKIHVMPQEADQAVQTAKRILAQIVLEKPTDFKME